MSRFYLPQAWLLTSHACIFASTKHTTSFALMRTGKRKYPRKRPCVIGGNKMNCQNLGNMRQTSTKEHPVPAASLNPSRSPELAHGCRRDPAPMPSSRSSRSWLAFYRPRPSSGRFGTGCAIFSHDATLTVGGVSFLRFSPALPIHHVCVNRILAAHPQF